MSSGLTRWTNNAQTTLNGGINASVTSIVVMSALGFPNPGPYRILIDNELMQVVGGYGTTTWTVATRGSIEGTAATTHSNLAAIIHDVTAFEFNAFRQDWNPISYGGVGDGVANDFTPIQTAVNDAHAQPNGGLVYLGSRSWKLDSALTTYANVAFVSEGAVLSGTGASSVTPIILWTGTGALTLPAALTVQSGGAIVTGAISSTSSLTGTTMIPTGLTGATQASRYVGATTSGAPVSGTFATGDYVITRDGFIYVCIAAGTPGTWQQPAPSLSYGSNIKALGTLSGGSDAAIARDDHIHPTTNVALLDASNTFTLNNIFSGGITGTLQTASQGNVTSLGTLTSLNVSGDIVVDSGAANTGSLTNSVKLGGIGSGEGIASKRNSGGNQYGLDFYANSAVRFHISNSGDVYIDSGRLLISSASSKIVPGSTSLTLRNNADNADNLKLDDGGAAHFRSTVDGISTITATTFSGALSGNATTATTLQTARNINGVSFNGSADITVTAAAGTLTGGTLASGVTGSSLTSVGTLGSLTMGGTLSKGSNAITGSRNASDIYAFINAKTPDTVPTGQQIWTGPTDPGVSANAGDLWMAA